MKKIFKNYLLNVIIIVLLAAVALYFSLRGNFSEVMISLKAVHWSWLLFLGGYALLYQFLVAVILTELTKMSNPNYSYRKGMINAIIASFFHGITPSASGGQFAQVYVYKKQDVDVTEAVSVLWMDFIVYQSTMVITVLVLLLLRFGNFYNHYNQLFTLVILGFIVNGAIIIGLWVLARFSKIYMWISTRGVKFAYKLKLVKNEEKTVEVLNESIRHFEKETLKFQTHKKLIIKVFVINLIRLCVYYLIPYFVALALAIPVPSSMIIDIMALTAFVSMINAFIPIPGASGGTEATFLLMFSTIVSSSEAASMMILWRFFSYYFVMFVGVIVFTLFKHYYAKKEGA